MLCTRTVITVRVHSVHSIKPVQLTWAKCKLYTHILLYFFKLWYIYSYRRSLWKPPLLRHAFTSTLMQWIIHYPSSGPEFTGRELGPDSDRPDRPDTRTRVMETGRPCTRPVYTGVRFPLPELTARVDGCQKMHQSSRAVNSARELGPWTRVLETDL